jgi:hypothetical protein
MQLTILSFLTAGRNLEMKKQDFSHSFEMTSGEIEALFLTGGIRKNNKALGKKWRDERSINR